VHYDAEVIGGRGMTGDELVRHRAGKAPAPALGIEAKQVIAIGIGFANP